MTTRVTEPSSGALRTGVRSVPEIVDDIRKNGYGVVDDVIPAERVGEIRREVVEAQRVHHEEAEAELAKIRARGHRVGVQGVAGLKQAINAT